jgi:hypothetical protein
MPIKQLDPRMIDPAKNTTLSNVSLSSIVITQSFTPSLSTSSGTAGSLRWDTNYLYICTATNTWKRAALSAWN